MFLRRELCAIVVLNGFEERKRTSNGKLVSNAGWRKTVKVESIKSGRTFGVDATHDMLDTSFSSSRHTFVFS
jgi:hypothetical protein